MRRCAGEELALHARGGTLVVGHDVGDARLGVLQVDLALHQRQLQAQQLVEDQALTGDDHVGHGLGSVDAGEGLGPRHQVVARQQRLGHRVRDPSCATAPQDLRDPVGQVPRRQT